eukprot:15041381-Alexandrium_andersonii.AAC.1
MNARHVSFLRRILRTPTTWGSLKTGTPPVKNTEVLLRAGTHSIANLIAEQQVLALGHLFRSGRTSPQAAVTYDRYLRARFISGTRRPGVPRKR